MRNKFGIVAIAAVAISLAGCDNMSSYTTEDPVQSVTGSATSFVVVTDWREIPSNSEGVSDVYVRVVKVQNVCYLQTGSVKDWQYSFVPTGATC